MDKQECDRFDATTTAELSDDDPESGCEKRVVKKKRFEGYVSGVQLLS